MPYSAELQALRELAWWILPQLECYFCEKPILELADDGTVTYGHRRHSRVVVLFTLHHKDECRENNLRSNLVIAHRVCHRSYHAMVRPVTITHQGSNYHRPGKGVKQ